MIARFLHKAWWCWMGFVFVALICSLTSTMLWIPAIAISVWFEVGPTQGLLVGVFALAYVATGVYLLWGDE